MQSLNGLSIIFYHSYSAHTRCSDINIAYQQVWGSLRLAQLCIPYSQESIILWTLDIAITPLFTLADADARVNNTCRIYILFPLADGYSFNFNMFVWMIMQSDFTGLIKKYWFRYKKIVVILSLDCSSCCRVSQLLYISKLT